MTQWHCASPACWPGAYLFVYNDHNDPLHRSNCHVPLECRGAAGTGRWVREKTCMQWQLGNGRFGILISDTLLWILRFGCAGLALPWQFQHFWLLNWFLCILLVLPPKSAWPWAWHLLLRLGLGAMAFPCLWQGACFGGFGVAGFHQIVFVQREDTELIVSAFLSHTSCQYFGFFFSPSSFQTTKVHSVSSGVLAFLFLNLNRVNVMQLHFGCRDCVLE